MSKIAKIIIVGSIIFGGFLYVVFGQDIKSILNDNFTDRQVEQNIEAKCLAKENTTVINVIDGDTVIVEGGSHIRLIGINAQEKDKPCYETAKSGLESLVLYKQVRLEKDVSDVDQYGRCLRTLFIGDQNINLQLVKDGLVAAAFYSPDGKYKEEIGKAEQEAIKDGRGCEWNKI